MKFVFFGYDFSLNIFERLIADGHEPLGVFSFPCDNQFSFNQALIDRINALGIFGTLEPPKPEHIAHFLEQGAALFVASGYLYKIPPIDAAKAYAVNIHPSLLPKGRGIMPTPYILTGYPEAAGVTVHKITDDFDTGDILVQKPLSLSDLETVETYSARAAFLAEELLSEVIVQIKEQWAGATAQDESQATYFPKPTAQMRFLDWSKPVEELARLARAFGRFGCVGICDGQHYAIYHLDVWTEKHTHKPGTIVRHMQREMIVAAKDGFVCIKDFESVQV